jgi:NADH-ubiquinone oxidoreductase chain 2
MILGSALNKGYVFLTLVAIITSVISAVYYLAIVKQIFFEVPESYLNFNKLNNKKPIYKYYLDKFKGIEYISINITLLNSLTIIISIFTLILLLFIFMPQE